MASEKLSFISYPKNLFPPMLDKILRGTTMISLITIFQGSLGGMGVIQIPQRIDNFFKKDQGKDIELAAEDLRMATRHLGGIVGKVDVEEVLGSIFKDFCIGK